MTDFKRKTLYLTTGKQIKLFGNSIAIGKSLEIGEGYAPNIFSCVEQQQEEKITSELPKEALEGNAVKQTRLKKITAAVSNPHKLAAPDLMEIADYNIRLWLDLKDNIRRYGVNNPKVFDNETLR
jgi:hypothetical protein